MLYPQSNDYWIKRPSDDSHRDWGGESSSWIQEYVKSIDHPHRQYLISSLKKFEPFESVLEIGCNAGPNLSLISKEYPNAKLVGIDVNKDSIKEAQKQIPTATIYQSSVLEIPLENKSVDVVLSDAVLMYIEPGDIYLAVDEIDRVSKKGVILFEWDSPSRAGDIRDYHWARNYDRLFSDIGFIVRKIKITEEIWPTSKSWQKNGAIFECHLRSQTSKIS